jgi:hypothetical protein
MTSMTATRTSATTRRSPLVIGLCVVDAALLVVSGLIHLHYARGAYRHVHTLNWMFVVQFVACLAVALVLLVTRLAVVAVAGAVLLAGTIIGFILARTRGIFGFHLTFSSSLANEALVVEAAGVVLLAATGWILWRHRA